MLPHASDLLPTAIHRSAFVIGGAMQVFGMSRKIWLRGLDLNQRPSGYEPVEIGLCKTTLDKKLHE
jgi:hypothetical protein